MGSFFDQVGILHLSNLKSVFKSLVKSELGWRCICCKENPFDSQIAEFSKFGIDLTSPWIHQSVKYSSVFLICLPPKPVEDDCIELLIREANLKWI